MQVMLIDVDTREEIDRLEVAIPEVSLMIQASSFAIGYVVYSVVESQYDFSRGITFLYVEVIDN